MEKRTQLPLEKGTGNFTFLDIKNTNGTEFKIPKSPLDGVTDLPFIIYPSGKQLAHPKYEEEMLKVVNS
jgi:hypothetical protein